MPTTTNVTAYGATGNGTTDDWMAIQTAINSTSDGGIVYLPVGKYLVSAPIGVGRGVSLVGLSYGAENVNGSYARIVGDATVSPVIQLTGAPGLIQGGLLSLGVSRNTTTPTANMVGVQVAATNNAILEDLIISYHGIGVQLSEAVSTKLSRVNTFGCTENHILVGGLTVELDLLDCRLGRNTGSDSNCTTMFKLTGNSWDTIRVTDCQFNLGPSGPGTAYSAIHAISVEGGYNNPNGIVTIKGGHFEGFAGAFLVFDSSVVRLRRLKLIGVSITSASSGVPLLIGTAGKLNDFILTDSTIDANVTLDQVDGAALTGNVINGSQPFLVNSSNGAISGNVFRNAVSLSGAMPKLAYVGNSHASLSNTSTAVVANNA